MVVDAGDGVAEADRGLAGEAGREAEHSPLAAELGSSPASRALIVASQSMLAISVRGSVMPMPASM